MVTKRENVRGKVEKHLREISRHLLEIESEEEALLYVADSFREGLYSDFVGIFSYSNNEYLVHTFSGQASAVKEIFPLKVEQCNHQFLKRNVTSVEADEFENCALVQALKQKEVKTWFTLPLTSHHYNFGFCIVGFFNYIPLLDMDSSFEEFAKDVIAVLRVASEKKRQQKKMYNLELLEQNLSIEVPLEQHIKQLTERAGKETKSDSVVVYLYDEQQKSLRFHQPAFKQTPSKSNISLENTKIEEHFPYLDTCGGNQISISLSVQSKLFGIMHLEYYSDEIYTKENLLFLKIVADQMLVLLENTILYNTEQLQNDQLRFLLDYQQSLIKETIEVDNFEGIIQRVNQTVNKNVVLYDRFFQHITDSNNIQQELILPISEMAKKQYHRKKQDHFLVNFEGNDYCFWTIQGHGNVLGFISIKTKLEDLDEFDLLTMELVRNICSVQFIKHKLVLDNYEQAKESFMDMLFAASPLKKESIIQYANTVHVDFTKNYEIAVVNIFIRKESEVNLLERHKKVTHIWDYIKNQIANRSNEIFVGYYKQQGVIFKPCEIEWPQFYQLLPKWAKSINSDAVIQIGVGPIAEKMEDFAQGYEQAHQTLSILLNRFPDKTMANFRELGAYTILHYVGNNSTVQLFIEDQIGQLISYSQKKNNDLFNTLYVYLQNNGHLKNTAEALYIHRSSLIYRMDRIAQLLKADLEDAEVRFNLLMAYKLYDMFKKER